MADLTLKEKVSLNMTDLSINADQAHLSKQTPESPTTAKQLDFDDDLQETSSAKDASKTDHESSSEPKQEEEAPPTKPPRPLNPREQAENTLIEAFPGIDSNVVKAVLSASGGRVEPAFNALLGNVYRACDQSMHLTQLQG